MTIEADLKKLLSDAPLAPVVSFAQELIQQRSLSGQERPVVNACIRRAARLGFQQAYFDRMGNFVGRIKVGSGKGPRIVLTGHLDTVNADPAQWSDETRPYAAVIRDGKLFGRGASDMKGAVAAMLQAAHLASRLPEQGYSGEVCVVGTVVEELFEGVCFLDALEQIEPDYVIVGEASQCQVNIAQRGRAEILISIFGEGKHASVGRTAINPVEQVAYVIDEFHRWYRSEAEELLGKRNVVPTDIRIPVGGGGGLDGRGGNSTVPNRVELTYDLRTLPGDSPESIMKLVTDQLERVIEYGRRRYPSFHDPEIVFASERCVTHTGIELEQPKFAAAWKTDPQAQLVVKALAAVERVGLSTEVGSYKFCTDGSAMVSYLAAHPERDCQVIGFGPSVEKLAHVIDEYVELDQLEKALHGTVAILTELLRV